ncbi:MAG: hypothetical protein ACSHWQ_03450 [Spongiibacteraceae bacterium]
MRHCLRTSLVIIFTLFIANCGGDSGTDPSLSPSSNNGATDDAAGDDNAADTSSVVRFGTVSGGAFVEGLISATTTSLTQGESATLSVSFVDENSVPVSTAIDVSFTSTCLSADASSVNEETVTNSNGLVSVVYTPSSCNIEDMVIAQATVNGNLLTASVTIENTPNTNANTTTVRLGSVNDGTFSDGLIRADFSNLNQGDTTTLSLALVDQSERPYTVSADVSFTSTCISAELSNLSDSSVTNTNGLIETQYTSTSCNGEDRIIASTTINNVELFAYTTLTTTLNSNFGSYIGGILTEGVLNASATEAKTGETINLSVLLLDGNEDPIDTEVTVGFSSDCVARGLATITPNSTTNTTGNISATYTANGCEGDDIIVAQTRLGGETLTATATVTVDPLQVRLGSLDPIDFVASTLSSSNAEPLAPGDTTVVTAVLFDQNDELYTGPADLFFSSACLSAGTAEIDTPVAANNAGTVTVNYTARGCDGSDTITAITSVAGTTLTASVDVNTEQAVIGGVQFVSATPQVLRLNGTGGSVRDSQSTLIFKITSADGNALPNQTVSFSLNHGESIASDGNDGTDAFLSSYQEVSDIEGLVTTVVNAGTNAQPVRVTASATQDSIAKSAVSSSLSVTTGIPDQDSMSISASALNIEGNNYDGSTTEITMRAADRFNNPVLDGTAIIFTTEGGSIDGECFTANGACSVTLTSQNPRPTDGNVRILAYAIGEESFTDSLTSNGRLDTGENFSDIAEPFRDDNDNGVKDDTEIYRDTNDNDSYDGANGLFEGLLCDAGASCNPDQNTTYVSAEHNIVFGSSHFSILVAGGGPVDLDGGDQTFSVIITDAGSDSPTHNKLPPAGTTVSVSTDIGTIRGGGNETVLDSTADGPLIYTFTIEQASEPGSGEITVKVTTPLNFVSEGRASVIQTVTPP